MFAVTTHGRVVRAPAPNRLPSENLIIACGTYTTDRNSAQVQRGAPADTRASANEGELVDPPG
jgi:hypothetical protein